MKGILVVISGPSGVGKGSIIKNISELEGVKVSISATTRKARAFERNGEDYFFIERSEFENLIKQDDIVEYNEYCGNLYGTIKSKLELMLKENDFVFLEVDVNGARNICKKFDCVKIFILPPSIPVLKERLRLRGTETDSSLKKRLDVAQKEIKQAQFYDYVIVNDDLIEATENLKCIINSQKFKISNMKYKLENILNNF